MIRSERHRREILERSMNRVDNAILRALSDMATAGYDFTNLTQARRYLAAIRARERAQAEYTARTLPVVTRR